MKYLCLILCLFFVLPVFGEETEKPREPQVHMYKESQVLERSYEFIVVFLSVDYYNPNKASRRKIRDEISRVPGYEGSGVILGSLVMIRLKEGYRDLKSIKGFTRELFMRNLIIGMTFYYENADGRSYVFAPCLEVWGRDTSPPKGTEFWRESKYNSKLTYYIFDESSLDYDVFTLKKNAIEELGNTKIYIFAICSLY